jgi:hypothetical protein
MSSRASDLVRDSRLNTTFLIDQTQHVSFASNTTSRQGKIRIVDTWRQQRELGNGAYGQVWLERCVSGNKCREALNLAAAEA